MGNDVGVDPRNRFSSVPIFSLPQRRENGCREAVWGPESPPSGAIDPHAPPASAKQSRLRVAHGRALRGSRRLSVPPLKFGRTPSLSAGRRRRDRATSNFRFSTVLATLTRGFRSTMRDRPHLLRAKVRQLHQVSLRGMGASNSRYSGSYAVFQISREIEFLAFSAIFTVYSCRKEHTEKARERFAHYSTTIYLEKAR